MINDLTRIDNQTLLNTGVGLLYAHRVPDDRGLMATIFVRADVIDAVGELVVTEAHNIQAAIKNLDGTVTGSLTTVSTPNNTASGLTFAVSATGTLAFVKGTASASSGRKVLLSTLVIEV